MGAPASVGVDNGGTWIRMSGVDARGRRVWNCRRPSPSLDQLPAFLSRTLGRWDAALSHLTVGSRGVWTNAQRSTLRRALCGLARRVEVMSDVEAAWLGAFGEATPLRAGTGTRVMLIAGTGSIALGRSAGGHWARAGGLGPSRGDEGSGFWVGKEWLKRSRPAKRNLSLNLRIKSPRFVRRTAALAPRVLHRALQGNPLARQIIQEGQDHLISTVREVVRKLNAKDRLRLGLGGRLFENHYFRTRFLKRLTGSGFRFVIAPSKLDAATVLARLPLSWSPPSPRSRFPASRSIMGHASR